MDLTPYITSVIGLVGTLAGAGGVWHAAHTKTKAEAADAERDDDRDDARAVDSRWQAMLEQQRAHFALIITPIQADVESLRREVHDLRTALEELRSRYRAAIDFIRALLAWARTRPDGTTAPGVPPILSDEV